jgi:hypothetical protein
MGREPDLDEATELYGTKPQRSAEVAPADRVLLDSDLGHEDDHGITLPEALAYDELEGADVGARPVSEITAEPDPGTPDETIDGLDPTEEAVRREAEDRPVGFRDD